MLKPWTMEKTERFPNMKPVWGNSAQPKPSWRTWTWWSGGLSFLPLILTPSTKPHINRCRIQKLWSLQGVQQYQGVLIIRGRICIQIKQNTSKFNALRTPSVIIDKQFVVDILLHRVTWSSFQWSPNPHAVQRHSFLERCLAQECSPLPTGAHQRLTQLRAELYA